MFDVKLVEEAIAAHKAFEAATYVQRANAAAVLRKTIQLMNNEEFAEYCASTAGK